MKNRYNINGRKGNYLVGHAVDILVYSIGLLVTIYFIWSFVLHGAGDNLDKMNGCGPLSGGRGQCKESCDTNLEYTVEGAGCTSKSADKCCVLIDENARDLVLQTGYGGSTGKYQFEVQEITFDNPASFGCSYEPTDTGQDNTAVIICPPNRRYTIPVTITVENLGSELLKISAVPVVVISGNADTIKPAGTYQGTVEELQAGQSAPQVTAKIEISNTESKANNYIDIYPYVKCETRQCKSTDDLSRGILDRGGEEDYITIKFQDATV